MQSNYDLIIFDCDGTLIDSENPASKATSEVLQGMGFKQYTHDYCYANFASLGLESMLTILQMELGSDFDARHFAVEEEKALRKLLRNGFPPMAGAAEILWQLRDFPKCVASNGNRDYVMKSLEIAGLLKFFEDEAIFSYHQAGRPKPAPDLFLFAAESMGVIDPRRCLVVEDSDTGAMAANQANMDVVIVRRKSNPRQHAINTLSIKGFVSDLTELTGFIYTTDSAACDQKH